MRVDEILRLNALQTGELRGPQGLDGPAGDDGEQGRAGLDGQDGRTGSEGPRGERGERGPEGDQGEKGDQGDKGERGEKGEVGARGERGEKGERGGKGEGERGERGLAGKDGEDGKDGRSVKRAKARTLPPGAEATAEYHPVSGLLELGIPRGEPGLEGNTRIVGGGGGISQATFDTHAELDAHDIPTYIQDTDPALPAPAKYLWVKTIDDTLWYNDGQVG